MPRTRTRPRPTPKSILLFASGLASGFLLHNSQLLPPQLQPAPATLQEGAARFDLAFMPSYEGESLLLDTIKKAKRELWIAIYSFTADAVAEALLEARKRGVKIYIVTDRTQAKGKGSCIPRLVAAGIPVVIGKGKIMHHKVLVADGAVLITGSYNWTKNAARYNQENLLRLTGAPQVVARYAAQMKKSFAEGKPYHP